MSPIPLEMREQLAEDYFMTHCVHYDTECKGRVEWEHAIYYAGRQINELWTIVPVCTYHHRGGGLNKEYNRFWAFTRLWSMGEEYLEEQLKKYYRAADGWVTEYDDLKKKYGTV